MTIDSRILLKDEHLIGDATTIEDNDWKMDIDFNHTEFIVNVYKRVGETWAFDRQLALDPTNTNDFNWEEVNW